MYLFFGLVLMLLLVANVYDVPELNLGRYFYVHGDDVTDDDGERQRLQSPSDVATQPPRYTADEPGTAAADHDVGGGAATKRSKKPEDKKRLTDDSM